MLQFLTGKQPEMIASERALAGRSHAIVAPGDHFVLGTPMAPPFPEGTERVVLGMGCFWGAERIFWQLPGVHVTAVGYAGGYTPNPTYEEACSGRTGHTEAVLVVFRAAELPFAGVLRAFWEGHDPTQGMRQGNDVGTQYRSALYTTTDAQHEAALASRGRYEEALRAAGRAGDGITTEIAPTGELGRKQPAQPGARGSFFYAEEYHQQYLAKNPGGYCGIGGTGVACPVGTGVSG